MFHQQLDPGDDRILLLLRQVAPPLPKLVGVLNLPSHALLYSVKGINERWGETTRDCVHSRLKAVSMTAQRKITPKSQRKTSCPEGWMPAGARAPVRLTVKQEQYCRQAIGINRFCYNLAVATHRFHRVNRPSWPSGRISTRHSTPANMRTIPSLRKSPVVWPRAPSWTSAAP